MLTTKTDRNLSCVSRSARPAGDSPWGGFEAPTVSFEIGLYKATDVRIMAPTYVEREITRMPRLRIAIAAANRNDLAQLQDYAASRVQCFKVVAAHEDEDEGAVLRMLMKAKAERFIDGILMMRGSRPIVFH